MITRHNTKALLDLVAAEIADMEKERDAGRISRGEIITENHALRDRLTKTDATLMELCQLLQLDPTGDPVAQLRARRP